MYDRSMQIFFGTDHGGFRLKEYLKHWLAEQSFSAEFEVVDLGAFTLDPDDSYVPFAQAVAKQVQQDAKEPESEPVSFGILLCRTGGGMSIAANRYDGVRAVVCRNRGDALHARAHNNANVVVLEGDRVSPVQAEEILQTFLTTPFEEGRHLARIRAIEYRKET